MTVSNLHQQLTDHMTPASCYTVHDIEGLEALPIGTELTDKYEDSYRVVPNGLMLLDEDGEPALHCADSFDYFDIEYPFVVENAAILGREVEEPTFTRGDRVLVGPNPANGSGNYVAPEAAGREGVVLGGPTDLGSYVVEFEARPWSQYIGPRHLTLVETQPEPEEEPLAEWERELLGWSEPTTLGLDDFKPGDRVVIECPEDSQMSDYNGPGVVRAVTDQYLKVEVLDGMDWGYFLPEEVSLVTEADDEPESAPASPFQVVTTPEGLGVTLPVEHWTEAMHSARALIVAMAGDIALVGVQPLEDRAHGLKRLPYVIQESEVERAQ